MSLEFRYPTRLVTAHNKNSVLASNHTTFREFFWFSPRETSKRLQHEVGFFLFFCTLFNIEHGTAGSCPSKWSHVQCIYIFPCSLHQLVGTRYVGSSTESSITPRSWYGPTLPETNSEFAPKNGWLEYVLVSFWQKAYFQGDMLVSGRVSYYQPQMLNVWSIYLHLPPKLPECEVDGPYVECLGTQEFAILLDCVVTFWGQHVVKYQGNQELKRAKAKSDSGFPLHGAVFFHPYSMLKGLQSLFVFNSTGFK